MRNLSARLSILLILFVLFILFLLKTDTVSADWVCLEGSQCIGGRNTCDIDYPGSGYTECQNLVCGRLDNPSCVGQCCRWEEPIPTPAPTPTPTPSPSCVNDCTPNSSWCLSNTTYNVCDAQINGCWYGGSVRSCPSGYSCDWGSGSCVAPTPVNDCAEAGYAVCTPGQPDGTCTLNGQTCTSYSTYECSFNGQAYCGPPFTPNVQTCAAPCTGPTPSHN